MRSLLAAILSLFLPARGVHRAVAAPPTIAFSSPPVPVYRPAPPCPFLGGVIWADGAPLVLPYLAVWERERDALDRRRLQRARRRAAVLATMGQDCGPWEAAV
ncbi:hypothetical protein [Streptomyces brasiliscabiei]|uniref:hypothetical protein n=1 Tax=Streptomyces brasiliscabiei TaxID=2736302 RepID=UPI001C11815F|nr:hypothetical protein [Streptomyces brasiliscabiei]